ncbi:MAG: Flp family type IVb pilin [Pedococcus sp.]
MTALHHTLQRTIRRTFHGVGRREQGITAVEYGLMVALIAVIIIAAIAVLGERVLGIFDGSATSI